MNFEVNQETTNNDIFCEMGLDSMCIASLAEDDEDELEFFSFVGMNPENFNRVYFAAANFGISRQDLVAECMSYYRSPRSIAKYEFMCQRRCLMRKMWKMVSKFTLQVSPRTPNLTFPSIFVGVSATAR